MFANGLVRQTGERPKAAGLGVWAALFLSTILARLTADIFKERHKGDEETQGKKGPSMGLLKIFVSSGWARNLSITLQLSGPL